MEPMSVAVIPVRYNPVNTVAIVTIEGQMKRIDPRFGGEPLLKPFSGGFAASLVSGLHAPFLCCRVVAMIVAVGICRRHAEYAKQYCASDDLTGFRVPPLTLLMTGRHRKIFRYHVVSAKSGVPTNPGGKAWCGAQNGC